MSGPKSLGDTLALIQAGIEARRRKRIDAAARPGETFEQISIRSVPSSPMMSNLR